MEAVKELSVSEQAKLEVKAERVEKAKEKLKQKYRQLEDAELIVRNIQRDIEDYLVEIDS